MASRAETDLTLACARQEPLRDFVRLGIDWTAFFEKAAWHGLLPLAYWRLNADCPDAVPAEASIRLRNVFREAAGHNLLLASELLNVLELLRRKQIGALPLKGPVLAFGMYENYALREFEDLDILVHRSQAKNAIELHTASIWTIADNVNSASGSPAVISALAIQVAGLLNKPDLIRLAVQPKTWEEFYRYRERQHPRFKGSRRRSVNGGG